MMRLRHQKNRFALWIALGCLLLIPASARSAARENLLANAGFEETAAGVPEGWTAFWSREPNAGAMTLHEQVKHGGQRSLKVTHQGSKDWSVSQVKPIPVAPGDIVTIGAWLKAENVAGAEIGVITRRANGETIDWMAGRAGTSGTHDWRHVTRKFVIPADVATIQFRLTGSGPGAVWLDDAELSKGGNVNEMKGPLRGKTLEIGNQSLLVHLQMESGVLSVTDKRTGQIWRQQPFNSEIIVKSVATQDVSSLVAELWDVANDLNLRLTIALAADKPELVVSLNGDGAVAQPVAFPQPFVTEKGTTLVVPLNEGILYPVDDESVHPMQLVTYSGHGICMPWFGVADTTSGAGFMAIIGTPDDARIDITRRTGSELFVRPLWEASRGQFGYERKLTYAFFDKGGYVAQAKRYRDYAKQAGLFKTLDEKRRENPNVDLLMGAANIWNWDMDKVALCQEMKAAGMDHVLWSAGGNSEQLAEINKLGYLTGRYDIYQDVWPPEAPQHLPREGWPEDLVWLANGDWMRGWAHHRTNPDGTKTIFEGGVICSTRQLPRAGQRVPAELKTHPYGARFLDTTTASPWRECYNPAHPLTRSEDRRHKMALLEFMSKEMKLVTGTETGIDPSVPYVHYYEGMLSLGPYRLPDAGRDMIKYKEPTPDFLKFQVGPFYRVPLWELVYHDCTVAQWYWGDYNNKAPEVWDRRDLFNILYGTPPMYMFDKATWAKDKARFVQSYQNICPLVRRLGYEEMLAHEFLTPDHAVQRTRWNSGTEIIVNLGDAEHRLADGRAVKA
ncbi:MAG: carbohydrate binding domain-containing protein, partial [Armatimonadota bacterium]|nr:carbohydrate binding domain-containing protein [Armatimonadota bacterium]